MTNKKVSAGPTKLYIINTITGDIRVEAAIFDLIDNSINAAETSKYPKRLSEFYVNLRIDKSTFAITDNCGGISKEKALGDAFKIGSSLEDEGGHGIGLKRAFLKFGKDIKISSNRNDYSFSVTMDVERWGKENNWDLLINEVKYNEVSANGVTISVKHFYDNISRDFSRAGFIENLKNEIAVRYRFKLKSGFVIKVNDEEIKPIFVEGDKVAESPTYIKNGMNIKVILYNNVDTKANGWDIIINGRVILHRDKSQKTLWRKKLIKTGCSYESFVGEVLINSDNIKNLPVLSTKDDIVTSSKAYSDILDCMYSFIDKHRDKFKKSEVTIQYSRPWDKVEKLKDLFNVDTAKETGERSFDNMVIYMVKDKEK
ncbi:ATP-binding protein [Clostridium sp.]|uniref:ATP-binding protein n=1 Tax=Clostridium sp. TaxID=1506 RepID=UPI002FC7532E